MKRLILFIIFVMLAALFTCNPMSEPTPDALCIGVHNKSINDICHGSKYLEPASNCSEANCHGSDIRGGNTGGPSCFSCHGDYWNVIKLHSYKIFGREHWHDTCGAADFTISCGSSYCHTSTLTGSNAYMKSPGCDTCHGIPTADGTNCEIYLAHNRSLDGARHHGDVCTTLVTCRTTDCHGVNLEGGSTGIFPARPCTRCHEHTPSSPGCDD